jgi:hypothetical protein
MMTRLIARPLVTLRAAPLTAPRLRMCDMDAAIESARA